MKKTMKKAICLASAMTMCLGILTACGGGLSGKYVSEATDMNYYDFKGGNKVVAGQLGVTMNGEYEVNGDSVDMVFEMEALGMSMPVEYHLTINKDGDLVDNTMGSEVIYSK